MAEKDDTNTKFIEHTIRGSVPPDEFEKFFKQHFSPAPTGGQAQTAARPRPTDASSICRSLGCPSTFGGGKLRSCSVDVEKDGSTTIHCHYELLVHP
jgi:hypothetical protein